MLVQLRNPGMHNIYASSTPRVLSVNVRKVGSTEQDSNLRPPLSGWSPNRSTMEAGLSCQRLRPLGTRYVGPELEENRRRRWPSGLKGAGSLIILLLSHLVGQVRHQMRALPMGRLETCTRKSQGS